MIEDIFSMFLAMVGIVCVVILTYYASKWYARRMGTVAGGKHIRIVDRLLVGKAGAILIIDVEGKQYLIGANDHSIELLKELEEPIDLSDVERKAGDKTFGSFRWYLHKGKDND
ncbi:MAG: FliO/MopB family protein [Anaerovoracaceae bacterium]